MAFVVEDGTGVANANSYVSIADADAYFDERGGATYAAEWYAATTTDEVKQGALLIASRWLDGEYRWIGEQETTTQGLRWPRVDAYDPDAYMTFFEEIPVRIVEATCEVALMHLRSALNATRDRGGAVASEQVDVISVTYFSHAPSGPEMDYLGRLLRGLHLGRLSGDGSMDTTL